MHTCRYIGTHICMKYITSYSTITDICNNYINLNFVLHLQHKCLKTVGIDYMCCFLFNYGKPPEVFASENISLFSEDFRIIKASMAELGVFLNQNSQIKEKFK